MICKEVNCPDVTEYLTVREAAQKLGVEPITIRNYLYYEELTAYKFKTATLVSMKEIEKRIKRINSTIQGN